MTERSELFKKLADKTLEGKLNWQGTAEENTFIAAVGGKMVFRLESMVMCWKHHPTPVRVVHLEVIGEFGDHLYQIISEASIAWQAWRLAQHSSGRPLYELADAILLLESL